MIKHYIRTLNYYNFLLSQIKMSNTSQILFKKR
jgi:hypothetical protein